MSSSAGGRIRGGLSRAEAVEVEADTVEVNDVDGRSDEKKPSRVGFQADDSRAGGGGEVAGKVLVG